MKQFERSKGRDNNLLFKEIKADSLRWEDCELKQTNKQTNREKCFVLLAWHKDLVCQ